MHILCTEVGYRIYIGQWPIIHVKLAIVMTLADGFYDCLNYCASCDVVSMLKTSQGHWESHIL